MMTEKFWAAVEKTDGCWLWQKSCGGHGYGQFYAERRKPIATHRFAWTLTNGPIPDGLHVLHHCDNKRCVRPSHLFLGTQSDNMRDMCAKGRHARHSTRGEDAGTAKLTETAVRDIRRRLVRGTRQAPGNTRDLAKQYGVTTQAVCAVASKRTWRHVQ